MKRYTFILFLLMFVGCKHPNGNGDNTVTTTRVNKQAPPSFEEFVKRFSSDSCFQIDHISFPVEMMICCEGGMNERDSVFFIERSNWEYYNLFNPGYEEKVSTSIDADNNTVLISGDDCGIHVTFLFKNTNRTWTLYKIDDASM